MVDFARIRPVLSLFMKVIVLAAGRSKRLKPIEDKNFLEFLGKPLIQIQLEQLIASGFKDFAVIGGIHNLQNLKKIAEKIMGGKKSALKIVVLEQKDLDDGMAGALFAAEKFINNRPVLIVSANDVAGDEAYKSILKASEDLKNDSYILAKKVETYFPGGYLEVKSGLIKAIAEKPGAGKEPSDLVNIVVHFHRNSKILFETLHKTKSQKDDRYEVVLDRLIKQGVRMKAVVHSGFWQAVKYPWHVLDLMEYFLGSIEGNGERKGKNVEIAPSATIKGPVFLDDDVKIFDNAVISGPAYIGKNTVVATNALVRGSMIGENCVVGFGTEVARSYLGNNVWTHTNYVGDSVIGNNVSFGAGTVTGNLRLDEGNIKVGVNGERVDSGRNKFGLITGNNVRCGINTSFMPGVKIGNNSMIGAGIVVDRDVEDNKLVYGKTEMVIKENNAKLNYKNRKNMKSKL